MKTSRGNFFEDFSVGQVFTHATPRTISGGERALYQALYPSRFALYSSDEFARQCGLNQSPLEDLIVFHLVLGKTVPDISLNAVANLGYAECRFLRPVYTGDTLRAVSEIIGVKQNSNGKSGVVWLRTKGLNQRDETVLDYVRWVMVRKSDLDRPAPITVIPELAAAITNPTAPANLNFANYDFALAGAPHHAADYQIGEKIDHIDGITLSESEHMMATRLWQNTAKVHFDTTQRPDGRRLIYGGHIISMARALSFNGLANAQMIVAINAGSHANPAFADDTIWAWSEILDKTEIDGFGMLRLRLVATNKYDPDMNLRNTEQKYMSHILLDLDYWVLIPV